MQSSRPNQGDARVVNRRVYRVMIPMAGNPLEFEVCRCDDALSAVSVLASLLDSDTGALARITIEVCNG